MREIMLPMFTFVTPPDGGLIGWNDEISFEVTATDVEDGNIDCTNLNVVPSIGHLNHFHDDLTIDGCPKQITLDPLDHDIHGEMDIFYVIGVNVTDQEDWRHLIKSDYIQKEKRLNSTIVKMASLKSAIAIHGEVVAWPFESIMIAIYHLRAETYRA